MINTHETKHRHSRFQPAGDGKLVTMEVSFNSAADLEKIVEMGFDELLAKN